jgi:hypothetical protein
MTMALVHMHQYASHRVKLFCAVEAIKLHFIFNIIIPTVCTCLFFLKEEQKYQLFKNDMQ